MNYLEFEAPSVEESEQSLIKNLRNLELSIENNKCSPNLFDAESPFQWQASRFEEVSSEEVVNQAKYKAEFEYNSFDRFSRILTLVYEYLNNDNTDAAEDAMLSLENLLKQDDMDNFPELKLAMSHVFYAIEAHFLSVLGNNKLALEASERIIPMRELPTDAQAAIYALKAKFFSLYRKKGFQQAVESARKARELNPDEHKWMFLLAESLRREKKYFPSSELPREELELLEAAIEKDRNPQYLVHLALRCITCVNQSFASHRNDPAFSTSKLYQVVQQMEAEAVKMIKEALRIEPDDEIINRRCAFGLMKARGQTKKENKELIKRSLERALVLAPDSSMTLHFLGKYYIELGNDNAKALEYFQKAVVTLVNNYPAHCDLIRLQFDMYKSEYDPMPDFERLLKRQTELDPHYRHESLVMIGSYYLFVKQDLPKSIEYFEKVIDENGDPARFTTRLIFVQRSGYVDLLEVLLYKLNTTTKELPNKDELIKKLRFFSPKYYINDSETQIKYIEKRLEVQRLRSKAPEDWRKSQCDSDSSQSEIHKDQSVSNWRIRNDSENHSELSWRTEEKANEKSYLNWRVKRDSESSSEKSNWRSNSNRNLLTQRATRRGFRDEGTQRRSNQDSSDKLNWRGGYKI